MRRRPHHSTQISNSGTSTGGKSQEALSDSENSKIVGSEKSLLAKNSLWNLLGQGAPLFAAAFSIPLLIHSLGVDRFGMLTLAWLAIGYLSLFDFGVGRATTKYVAEYLSEGRQTEIPQLVLTSIVALVAIGVVIGAVIAWTTPWIVHVALRVPSDLIVEATQSLYIIALSLPLVLGATASRGYLEGAQRFALVNMIRIPGNVALVSAPLLVLPFSNSLVPVVASLVASRAALFAAYSCLSLRNLPGRHTVSMRWDALNLRKLLGFGGWLTLTNVVGSLMSSAYIDRILISHLLGIGALTFYVTPFEIISKLLIIPGSLIAVLFPAFVTRAADPHQLASLYFRAIRYIYIALLPLTMVVLTWAGPGLQIWIGKSFSIKATLLMQFFAIGVMANAMAYIPFVVTQALGRPDLTAKRHIAELPVYIGALYYSTRSFGIDGAAAVWAIWAVLDMVYMFAIAHGINDALRIRPKILLWFASTCFLMVFCILVGKINSLLIRGIVSTVFLGALLTWIWIKLIRPDEKILATTLLSSIISSKNNIAKIP